MTTALAEFKPKNEIETVLHQRVDSLVTVAPAGYSIARAIKLAAKACYQNADLLKCDPKSIVLSVANAVELGLDLSVTAGQAYLVPFGGKAQLIVGYRGWKKLVLESGLIAGLDAQCVYEGEEFAAVLGDSPSVRHVPNFKGGKIVGGYAIAVFKDGHRQVYILRQPDIARARSMSRGQNGPWKTDEGAMTAKTAVRRICKMLPETPLLRRANEIDEPDRGENPVVRALTTVVPLAEALAEHEPETVEEIPPADEAPPMGDDADMFGETIAAEMGKGRKW